MFLGSSLSKNSFFDAASFPYREVDSATFSLSRPKEVLRGGKKIVNGFRQSRRFFREFSPDLVVGFGSFYTLPVLLAAKAEKIPIVLYEQNAIPGKVNRLFSRFSLETWITFPDSRDYLKGEAREVIFPRLIREEGLDPWEYFGLKEGTTTLLIYGGSQGASRLNSLATEALSLFSSPFQVLHFTGKEEETVTYSAFYEKKGITACVRTFEFRIDLALSIADLAITRAGAGTIADLIESTTPAILLPFPFASENHQEANARFFVEKVGGGGLLVETGLTGGELFFAIDHLFKYRKEKQERILRVKEGRSLPHIHELLEELLQDEKRV
ncbi:MAG: UDP-N-acetylglucosamine--N-acetylmuramyl-(pentapeptide) pyrophosphoryl-undecaprenol N-acetylglucosamine transferase [Chlamydiae bacterium]|nr:UDP-N-acetylglucosamine--N-acetylmuramyl-(pentapeptide) pyrophosphoryl-undecaprenol N-acetylglucosamine transferase [Chlamydiota bacterium]